MKAEPIKRGEAKVRKFKSVKKEQEEAARKKKEEADAVAKAARLKASGGRLSGDDLGGAVRCKLVDPGLKERSTTQVFFSFFFNIVKKDNNKPCFQFEPPTLCF